MILKMEKLSLGNLPIKVFSTKLFKVEDSKKMIKFLAIFLL